MDIAEVKRNLNRVVEFSSRDLYIDQTKYILSGCMIRKNDQNEYYYTAELTSVCQPKSIIHVPLSNIRSMAAGKDSQ